MNDLYLKQLKLVNFCGYENCTFNFLKEDGTPYKFICFFGPNGVGKSTLLEAIMLLTMNRFGRGMDRIKQSLLKYIHNENYDPAYNQIGAAEDGAPIANMLVEGTYVLNDKEYIIQLTETGWVRNDFSPVPNIDDPTIEEMSKWARTGPWGEDHLKFTQRISHLVSSDNDLSLNKFQLVKPHVPDFEAIMTEIMRWPTKCIMPPDVRGMRQNSKEYSTDFVIKKTKRLTGKEVQVHFKRMSAGERKIAKSFSDLLNLKHTLANPSPGDLALPGWPRILLIDNVEMHAYYDRHVRLVTALRQIFGSHQIFATTHSGVLIKRHLAGTNDPEELYIDLDEVNG